MQPSDHQGQHSLRPLLLSTATLPNHTTTTSTNILRVRECIVSHRMHPPPLTPSTPRAKPPAANHPRPPSIATCALAGRRHRGTPGLPHACPTTGVELAVRPMCEFATALSFTCAGLNGGHSCATARLPSTASAHHVWATLSARARKLAWIVFTHPSRLCLANKRA